jgi:hypothetical protein
MGAGETFSFPRGLTCWIGVDHQLIRPLPPGPKWRSMSLIFLHIAALIRGLRHPANMHHVRHARHRSCRCFTWNQVVLPARSACRRTGPGSAEMPTAGRAFEGCAKLTSVSWQPPQEKDVEVMLVAFHRGAPEPRRGCSIRGVFLQTTILVSGDALLMLQSRAFFNRHDLVTGSFRLFHVEHPEP